MVDCRRCVFYGIFTVTEVDYHAHREHAVKRPWCNKYNRYIEALLKKRCKWYVTKSDQLDRYLELVKKVGDKGKSGSKSTAT